MIKLHKTSLSDGGIHLLLLAKVDGNELRFVLDTGASHSVMDIHWARKNLKEDEIKLVSEPAHGIGSPVEVHKAELSSFEFGDLIIQDHSVPLIDFNSINGIYEQEGVEEVHGILGGDILLSKGAVIDYNKMELHFTID